jgi:hypothetical protein
LFVSLFVSYPDLKMLKGSSLMQKKKELKYKGEKRLTMITFVSRDLVVAVQVVSSSGDLYY